MYRARTGRIELLPAPGLWVGIKAGRRGPDAGEPRSPRAGRRALALHRRRRRGAQRARGSNTVSSAARERARASVHAEPVARIRDHLLRVPGALDGRTARRHYVGGGTPERANAAVAMSDARDGMNWAPKREKPSPVVSPGEFAFASAFFDHGHIYGQTNGLLEAGGAVQVGLGSRSRASSRSSRRRIPACARRAATTRSWTTPRCASSRPRPCPASGRDRLSSACGAGKDYFTDKPPLHHVRAARSERGAVVRETGKKYMCDFSERLHTEAGWHAGELVREGAIGRVLQVVILAPHNLGRRRAARPGSVRRRSSAAS